MLAAWIERSHREHPNYLGHWSIPGTFASFLLRVRSDRSLGGGIFYRFGRLDASKSFGPRRSRDARGVAAFAAANLGTADYSASRPATSLGSAIRRRVFAKEACTGGPRTRSRGDTGDVNESGTTSSGHSLIPPLLEITNVEFLSEAVIESRFSDLVAATFVRDFPMRIHSGIVFPAFIFTSQTHGDPASSYGLQDLFFAENRDPMNAVSA